MHVVIDHILSVIVSILALLYVVFQGVRARWNGVLAFVIVFGLLWLLRASGCCGMGCVDWRVCLLIAIVASNVVALPQTVYGRGAAHGGHVEGFANSKSSKRKRSSRKREAFTSENNEDSATNAASTSDGTDNNDNNDNNDDDGNGGNGGYQDAFSTFMETYKSLSPNQIETMTTDTKELIQTQKALMNTVKSFAPILKDGREMMDTFKDYFGPSGTTDLMKAFGGSKDAKKEKKA